MPLTPEEQARINIDKLLADCGWIVQDRAAANITADRSVAIREFPLRSGFGEADYLLFVDGAAAGVIEAKKEGSTLTGFEGQTAKDCRRRFPHHAAHCHFCIRAPESRRASPVCSIPMPAAGMYLPFIVRRRWRSSYRMSCSILGRRFGLCSTISLRWRKRSCGQHRSRPSKIWKSRLPSSGHGH